MKKVNLKCVPKKTWIRTLVLLIALINQALVIMAKTSDEVHIEQWMNYVSYALTVISSIWTWWSNNSFTFAAIKADEYLKEICNSPECKGE